MIRLRYILSMLMLLAVMSASAVGQPARSIPNPNVVDMHDFIADPNGLLSRNTKNYVNDKIEELRKKTTCELGVAIVGNLGGQTIEEYAYDLFKHWGLGQSDVNNGVLLVISTQERTARIEVGSGAEGALTDMACANIIRVAIVPAMRDNNLNQAVSESVNLIYDVLTDPKVAEELKSSKGVGPVNQLNVLDGEIIWKFLAIVAGSVFLFSLVMFLIDFFGARKRGNYRRAMTWRAHLPTYWWAALLSCGLGLPLAFLAQRFYRRARDKQEICDTCGSGMRRLSEEEDNLYLTPSQDFEEKLGTVDYDVWLCPECGTVERFPYVENQLKYKRCPECGTIAENLVMDKVVEAPTTTKAGHGERKYQCQFCRNIRREGYSIPKRPNPAAAATAGAIAGSILGSGGHGRGGGFGGGFGGGHSSGGGATGRW